MTKNDWIEILNTLNNKDWTDWVLVIVSILSPIIVLISVYFVAKTAKLSKEATDLNYEMYMEQKEEREKSFQPIFKTSNLINKEKYIIFNLTNYNEKKIVLNRFASQEHNNIEKNDTGGDMSYRFKVTGDFIEKNNFKLWLFYTTLDHKNYCSEITFTILEKEISIYEHLITNRD